MSHTPREIGTLIVVIDKANHLPNKRHIGKQHPYCAVEFEGRKARTKTLKKGGQHPEWDEELRFPVYEDVEDELARTAGEERAPSPPPKDGTPSKPSSLRGNKSRSKKSFKLACYADDPKDPELIGETMVDLSTVLTKGEQDDWHTLMYKDKFAGKVYLELTFYSNEEPPRKAPKTKRSDYVGPGVFIGEEAKSNAQPRTVSTPHFPREPRMSLRNPSGPPIDLYSSPYDRSSVAADFSQLALSHSVRRESFPPSNGQSHHDNGYQPPRHSSSLPMDGYESDVTSTYSTLPPIGVGVPYQSYHVPYEPSPTPAFVKSSMRGPRYSVPASSSGFRALPTHPSDPSGFVPTSHTPAPSVYRGPTPAPYPSHFAPPLNYTPIPSQTPLPHSSSTIMPYPPSQPYGYPPQHPPPPPPGAPQHYAPQTPPHHHQQNYAPYPNGSPSPPSEPGHPIPPSSSLSSSHGPGGSRPLPQQPHQGPGPQFPPAMPAQPPYDYSNAHNSVMFPTANGFPAVPPPPPPPPPPIQSNNSPPRSPHQHYDEPQQYHQYQEPQQQQGAHLDVPQPGGLALPPPPPPPPISQFEPRQPQRRASLPQPPSRGALPIPPPPPLDFQNTGYPLPSHLQSYVPGPPPRPPQLDADGQWVPPPPPPPQPYPTAGWA